MGNIHSSRIKRINRNQTHIKEVQFVQVPNKAVFSHSHAGNLSRALRGNTHLETLELSDLKNLQPYDYAAIINGINFSRVKNLTLSNAKLGNEGITALINLLSPSNTTNNNTITSPLKKLTLNAIALEPSKVTALTTTLRAPQLKLKELILIDTAIENHEHVAALTEGLREARLEALEIVAVNHNTEEYGIRAIIHLLAKINRNVPYIAVAIKTVNETAAYKFADVLIANHAIKSFSLVFDPNINKLCKNRIDSSNKFAYKTEFIPSGFINIEKYTWTRM